MSQLLRVFFVSLMIVASGSLAGAGLHQWTIDGPPGANIRAVVVHPVQSDIVYAGTDSGLYRSADAGLSWSRVAAIPWGRVPVVAIHPERPDTIYAYYINTSDINAPGPWMFLSDDNGSSWDYIELPSLLSVSYASIHFDPQHANIMYLITFWDSYKSENGGQTWSRIAGGQTKSFCIHPENTNILYRGCTYGLYKSIDGGATFDKMENTLGGTQIKGLLFDQSRNRLCLAAERTSFTYMRDRQFPGFHYSTDGGITLQRSSAGLTFDDLNVIAQDPQQPDIFYAGTIGGGICRSLDGGEQWAGMNHGLSHTTVQCIAIDPQRPWVVYAGTPNGLCKSTDRGENWQRINDGLGYAQINSLASWQTGNLLAGTTGGEVYVKEADDWRLLVEDFRASGYISCLAISKSAPNIVYLGTSQGEIMKSVDSGRSWYGINSGLSREMIFQIAIHPTDSDVVLAATDADLFRTLDGGITWQRCVTGIDSPSPVIYLAVAFANSNPDSVYVYAHPRGVLRSTNRGESWETIKDYDGVSVFQILIHPENENIIFLGTSSIYYRSFDGGQTWDFNYLPSSFSCHQYLMDPHNNLAIYAVGTTGNIYLSENFGENWYAVMGTLMAQANSPHLTIDPIHPGVFIATSHYLRTADYYRKSIETSQSNAQFIDQEKREIGPKSSTYLNGIFRSIDGGNTWTAINLGMTDQPEYPIFHPTISDRIYCVTSNGVSRSDDSGQEWEISNTGFPKTEVLDIQGDPDDPSLILVGTMGGGAHKSQDFGFNWTQANFGHDGTSMRKYALSEDDWIYALTSYAVERSADNGDCWEYFGAGITSPRDIVFDPAQSGGMWLGTDTGLYCYDIISDGWSEYCWPFYFENIRSIIFTANGTLLVSHSHSLDTVGIYRRLPSGSWLPPGNGNDQLEYLDFAMEDSAPWTIYGATPQGVYRSFDDGVWWQPIHGSDGAAYIESLLLRPPGGEDLYATRADAGFMAITFGDGDLDHDGRTDAVDILLLAARLVGNLPAPPFADSEADVSIDGRLDILDLQMLQYMILHDIL